MAGTWNGTTFNGDDTNDVATGTVANERLFGNKGDDNLNGAGGDDVIDGGVGGDTLRGGFGNDRLTDVGSIPFGFTGLIGKDSLDGGAGDDLVTVLSPDTNDVVDGGIGIDTAEIKFNLAEMNQPSAISYTHGATSNIFVAGIRTVAVLNCEKLQFSPATNGTTPSPAAHMTTTSPATRETMSSRAWPVTTGSIATQGLSASTAVRGSIASNSTSPISSPRSTSRTRRRSISARLARSRTWNGFTNSRSVPATIRST